MSNLPSLREMLDAGVHFGHKTSRWHPKMADNIFTAKSGVHVINLELTQARLKEAIDFVTKKTGENELFIFVGTKKQSSEIIKNAAMSCSMPYVHTRWLGGTLTNFSAIRSAVLKYEKQKAELEKEKSDTTKSELSRVRKDVARGEKFLAGLTGLVKKPGALILFDSHDEKNAIAEARKEGIKIVALTDTNVDPNTVDFPIPANDDATKSVTLFAKLFADVINENKPKKDIQEK